MAGQIQLEPTSNHSNCPSGSVSQRHTSSTEITEDNDEGNQHREDAGDAEQDIGGTNRVVNTVQPVQLLENQGYPVLRAEPSIAHEGTDNNANNAADINIANHSCNPTGIGHAPSRPHNNPNTCSAHEHAHNTNVSDNHAIIGAGEHNSDRTLPHGPGYAVKVMTAVSLIIVVGTGIGVGIWKGVTDAFVAFAGAGAVTALASHTILHCLVGRR